MYFDSMVSSRAKLGLAFMELSYTMGLVSRGMTRNNRNSASRRIWTLVCEVGAALAATVLSNLLSLAWTEIVNCSSVTCMARTCCDQFVSTDHVGPPGRGFIAGRIILNSGVVKGKMDPNWLLCLVYNLNWTDLNQEPNSVELRVWNLFEAIQPKWCHSKREHVSEFMLHFNIYSLLFSSFFFLNLFLYISLGHTFSIVALLALGPENCLL